MAGPVTTNFNWQLPEEFSDVDLWGDILNTAMQAVDDDVFLQAPLDGSRAYTNDLDMGDNLISSLGVGVAGNDALTVNQLQNSVVNWVAAGGTVDVITATYSPVITAYVDGQLFFIRASGANTSATPTFAANGLAAHNITKHGNQALVAGDIYGAGHELILRYHLSGTRFELLNPSTQKAIASELNTGTDVNKLVTPDALAGSIFGTVAVSLLINLDDEDAEVGNDAGGIFFACPSILNGMNLVSASALVTTAGTTGAMTIMIRNETQAVDMLSAIMSIASGAVVSTGGTPDTNNDDVATGDVLRGDIDSIHTTPAKGLQVNLLFRLP